MIHVPEPGQREDNFRPANDLIPLRGAGDFAGEAFDFDFNLLGSEVDRLVSQAVSAAPSKEYVVALEKQINNLIDDLASGEVGFEAVLKAMQKYNQHFLIDSLRSSYHELTDPKNLSTAGRVLPSDARTEAIFSLLVALDDAFPSEEIVPALVENRQNGQRAFVLNLIKESEWYIPEIQAHLIGSLCRYNWCDEEQTPKDVGFKGLDEACRAIVRETGIKDNSAVQGQLIDVISAHIESLEMERTSLDPLESVLDFKRYEQTGREMVSGYNVAFSVSRALSFPSHQLGEIFERAYVIGHDGLQQHLSDTLKSDGCKHLAGSIVSDVIRNPEATAGQKAKALSDYVEAIGKESLEFLQVCLYEDELPIVHAATYLLCKRTDIFGTRGQEVVANTVLGEEGMSGPTLPIIALMWESKAKEFSHALIDVLDRDQDVEARLNSFSKEQLVRGFALFTCLNGTTIPFNSDTAQTSIGDIAKSVASILRVNALASVTGNRKANMNSFLQFVLTTEPDVRAVMLRELIALAREGDLQRSTLNRILS